MLDEDSLRSDREDRERRGGRYGDSYRDRYHRDDRHRRDRSRDRERRDDRGDGDRHRSDRRTDRHRRDERDYSSRGSSRRDRSKSRERRRRSRSHESRHRDRSREKSHGKRDHSSDREQRSRRDLSVEIEQELQNLRKLSDMKAALAKAKQQQQNESQERRQNKVDLSQLFRPAEKQKTDFMKQFTGSGNGSKVEYVPEIQTEEERIEFQKKMQEKLQAHLAAEGKLYPKPKPGPAINTATGFANDGSFLEMFKQMQQQSSTMGMIQPTAVPLVIPEEPTAVPYYSVTAPVPSASTSSYTQPKEAVPIPMVGRRRGGKILKTGIVKKPKPIEEAATETPNDAWNLYLQEVKKYKNASCDADSKTRPLVK